MEYAKGFKFRIYPNAEQQEVINQTLGCARFVYNHFLAVKRDTWQEKHESVTYVKSSRMLTELKCNPDFVWLKSVDSMALQEALRNLIKLPKIGIVKTKLSREFEGRILNATVSRTASGKYFVSLCVEMDIELLLGRNNGQQIGIDVGIKDFTATKNLGIRKWTCPQCNTYHDRDVNAARNILRKALEMQKSA